MTSKKNRIFVIICILSCCAVYAQELYRQTAVQQYPSYFPVEALKIDISKPPNAEFFSPPPSRSNYSSRQANNGWYPAKGEIYVLSETKIAGYVYHEIGGNGLLDKKIIVANQPNNSALYDSTVSVMNRTPYTKGKDLIDTTYNYTKKTDGSYRLEQRKIFSYHYFDHFEADSFYYEEVHQRWDEINHQWINLWRQKIGYHDTLVEFHNRLEEYYGNGNNWLTIRYSYDSITYDHLGFIDTLYMIRDEGNGDRLPKVKAGFTYNEQGHYTQIDFFAKNSNNWDEIDVYSNIIWTEWNGFSYCSFAVVWTERVSPYKRSKVKSHYVDSPIFGSQFYQKWWDINGMKSNSDTSWHIIDGELYYNAASNHIYNEYEDYVEYRYTAYSYPNENREQEIEVYSAIYNKLMYDDIYGMTENMGYVITLLNDGKIDTTFVYGFKYTEFAPVDVSITEHPQIKQALQIYPNPASGAITISASTEIAQLQIFDITGRMVENQSPASKQFIFNTDVLHRGIYFVRARLADGRVQTGKVVVR